MLDSDWLFSPDSEWRLSPDSNSGIESVNARIDVIKLNGNGYRNFERFKLRVLYSLNENSSIKI